VLRLGEDPWRVRVVPNLYPAFERQEVVIHSPEHVRSFAELDDDTLPLIAEAWHERADDDSVLAFVNEGRLAGASLPHSHSQLVVLPENPVVDAERPEALAMLDEERLAVDEHEDVVAFAHPAGAAPYECLIVPRGWTSDPFGGRRTLVASLLLLRGLVRRLHAVAGIRPWNAFFHGGAHPHAHFVPRLTALAGLELGAAVYVNIVPPEQAAEALRTTD
jgi:UDPglucose--hexose-1-phosphate uridylyltransferase